MKALFLLYFSLICILINGMPVLAAETRGIYALIPNQATNKEEKVRLYNKAYAVIIGIDRYKNLKPDKQLKNAVKDAQGIKETLTKYFSFDHIDTLYNEQATRDEIMRLLTRELPKTIGEDDALFLFWAGHGNQVPTNYGDLGYLIPYDGYSDDTYGNITMDDIKGVISKRIPAKHIFFAFDACYSGLLTTRGGSPQVAHNLPYLKEITKESVRQVLTAGSKDQETMDDGPKGHSVFSGRLIEILEQSDNFITVNDIQGKIIEKVHSDADARGHKQTPSYGVLSGRGDFVFVPNIEKKVRDSQTERDRIEAELKLLDEQASETQKQATQRLEADQKRKAEARLKTEQHDKQQLAEEQRMAAFKTEQEKLAKLRVELEIKRKSFTSSSDNMQGVEVDIKKHRNQITGIETTFTGMRQETNTRYDQMIKALNSEKRDEFEKAQDFNARISKEKEKVEKYRREELTQLDNSLASETAQLREKINKLSEKEFTLEASATLLELGLYDTEKERFPVTLISSPQSKVKIDVNSSIPLPPTLARAFKQQWQSGLVRPEVIVRSNGDIMRIAIINDVDNTLMIYESGEFLNTAEKNRRQAEQDNLAKAQMNIAKAKQIDENLNSKKLEIISSDSGNTISDVKQNFAWTKDSYLLGQPVDWKKTREYVDSMNKKSYLNYNNWRLPTTNELLRIYSKIVKPHSKIYQEDCYWSSDLEVGFWATKIKTVNMNDGHYDNKKQSEKCFIWPVRSLVEKSIEKDKFIDEWTSDIEELEKVIKSQQDSEESKKLGIQLYKEKNYSKALEKFNELIGSKKEDYEILYYRGVCNYNLGNFEKAITDFNNSLYLRPKFASAYFMRGNAHYKLEKWPKAIEDFTEAIKINDKDDSSYLNRGLAHMNMQRFSPAILDLSKTIELSPNKLEAYSSRAACYEKINDTNNAMKDYTYAINNGSNNEDYYYMRGMLYYKLHNNKLALQDFDKVIRINSKNKQAYLMRGVLYFDGKKYEQAIKEYNLAIDIDPEYALAFSNRSLAYKKLGVGKSKTPTNNVKLDVELDTKLSIESKKKVAVKAKKEKTAQPSLTNNVVTKSGKIFHGKGRITSQIIENEGNVNVNYGRYLYTVNNAKAVIRFETKGYVDIVASRNCFTRMSNYGDGNIMGTDSTYWFQVKPGQTLLTHKIKNDFDEAPVYLSIEYYK